MDTDFIIVFSTSIYHHHVLLGEFEATLTLLRHLQRNIPRVVNSNEFGFLARLRARLHLFERFGNLFLGYCPRHKTYFLDLEHTNGDIRCPICDTDWLLNHQARDQFTSDFQIAGLQEELKNESIWVLTKAS